MRLAILACLTVLTACTESVPIGGDAIAATGVFSDKLHHPTLELYLAHDVDTATCASDLRGSLAISLSVDERTSPHVLPGLDVQAAPGSVAFDDGDAPIDAVSGRVLPTLTTWGVRPGTNRLDRIVEVDGTVDIVLADGRPLSGSFSAVVCDE